jgi:uncharacterized membrane protein
MTLSRSLLIGLIVSAALNVFLIGGVAGAAWVRRTAPLQAPSSPAFAPLPPMAATEPDAAAPLQRSPQPPRPAATGVPAQGDTRARAPLWTAGQSLSPASRLALRQALREANRRNQPITRQARADREAALEALKSKTYDPAEIGKRFAAARALDSQARGNVEAALTTYAAGLSPEERAILADGLARIYAPRQKANPATP